LPVEDSHISHHFKVEQVMSEDDGRAVDVPAFEDLRGHQYQPGLNLAADEALHAATCVGCSWRSAWSLRRTPDLTAEQYSLRAWVSFLCRDS